MRPRLVTALLPLLPAGAVAATIHVPADYPTVLQALDAAVAGDIVELAPGEYTDFDTRTVAPGFEVTAVGFVKAGVTLRSAGGAALTTLRISAPAAYPAVLFLLDARDIAVQGLTLTGDPDADGIGSDVPTITPGQVTLEDCIVENLNWGMYVASTSATIRRCSFRGIGTNAVDLVDSPSLVLEDTEFTDCSYGVIVEVSNLQARRCTFQGSGIPPYGAVLITLFYQGHDYESVALESCLFVDNPGGPSIGSRTGTTTVTGCTFIRTALTCFGPGEFAGNTFYGGEVTAPLLDISVPFETPDPFLGNNIFAYGAAGSAAVVGTPLQSECNDFWSNAGGNATYLLGPTDILLDPQFCDRLTDDLQLFLSSPCLAENNPSCGQIGSMGSGCGPVSVQPLGWGQVKALYR